MAFPASNGSVPLTLDQAWIKARDAAAAVKSLATLLTTLQNTIN